MNALTRAALAVALVSVGCSSEARPPGASIAAPDGADAALVADGAAGSDGSVADGSSSDVEPADVAVDAVSPDAPSSVCPKGYPPDVASDAVAYPKATDGEVLAAITWDERTMAWTTKAGGVVEVHYADRADGAASFSSSWTLSAALGPFPDDKVALSADGLVMLVMSGDHQTVRQLQRTARGAPFDATVTTAPFDRLTGVGAGTLPRQLGDLVLSKDGATLFYTDLRQTSGASLRMSKRLGDGTWDTPSIVDAKRLSIDGGSVRHPTGLSADGAALFYFDDASESPFVAFRKPGTTEFIEFFAVVPTGRSVMPTDACDRLYLSAEVAPPKDGSDVPTRYEIVHAP